jgi:glycosyltransferase involved in cell wall biosynthesis
MKKCILYIGPEKFRTMFSKKNVELIYPSLFESIKDCKIHLLHGDAKIPNYVKNLNKIYDINFHYVSGKGIQNWIDAAIWITKTQNIDVLTNVFLGYQYGFIAAMAAKATNRRSIVRFAANEIYVRKTLNIYKGIYGKYKKYVEKKQEKEAIKNSNLIIAMSPWEKKRLEKYSSIPGKVKWCMRGINLVNYKPDQRKINQKAKNFVYVGRKDESKGYKLIISVAKLIYSINTEIQFYFAGDFDIYRKDNLHFLGYLDKNKIIQLYKDMDVLILPSKSEGFANVIVEAMATGVPCIISDKYHNGFFTNGKNAILTNCKIKDLKEKILLMHNDKKLIKNMRSEVRKLAIELFDQKHWEKKYRKILLSDI